MCLSIEVINIATPEKYIFNSELVATSQKHHESHSAYQSLIDKILICKRENVDMLHNELVMYSKGILDGRSKKRPKK